MVASAGVRAIAVAIALAACTSTAGVALPAHKQLNSYPAALLEATLRLDGECLVAVGPTGERDLPIWPQGFSLVNDAVLNGSTQVATVGRAVTLGGGEYDESQFGFLRSMMLADLPEACRVGKYWLVASVA